MQRNHYFGTSADPATCAASWFHINTSPVTDIEVLWHPNELCTTNLTCGTRTKGTRRLLLQPMSVQYQTADHLWGSLEERDCTQHTKCRKWLQLKKIPYFRYQWSITTDSSFEIPRVFGGWGKRNVTVDSGKRPVHWMICFWSRKSKQTNQWMREEKKVEGEKTVNASIKANKEAKDFFFYLFIQ